MADRQEMDHNGMSESNDSGALGNRPATGARLVDNAAGLASSFGGGQEATDFLGLSQELGGLEPDAASESMAPTGFAEEPVPPSSADPSASWLLSQGDDAAAEEDAEEESIQEEEEAPVETGRSRRILSVAAAILVIGAAVTVAMKFSAKKDEPTLLTQHAPAHTAPSTGLEKPPTAGSTGRETILPNGETVPVATNPVVETPAADTETVAVTTPANPEPVVETTPIVAATEPPAPPRLGGKRLADWMGAHGWSPSAATEASDTDLEASAAPTPASWAATAELAFAGRPSGALPPGDPSTQWSGDPQPDGGALPEAAVILANGEVVGGTATSPSGASGTAIPAFSLRMASEQDLAGIWKTNTVPMDLLDSETRIMTPAVGAVRVVLKTGEIFDGRLYAVGQGQVWLETDIGRLAVAAKHVLRIDQSVIEKDAKTVDSLPRMRVRTPGGLFFGKVLSRDEAHVTLLLDGGGRITLESADVEPAPLGDTRLIGPVKH